VVLGEIAIFAAPFIHPRKKLRTVLAIVGLFTVTRISVP
jgi:hypothetical protein